MNVSELGEFGLIERLRASIRGAGAAERLVVGPGDDAAVWRFGERCVIATTDTMVAGVHFVPGRVSWTDVGWKALATNISDVAAMGGTPSFALVTLSLPEDTTIADIDALYDGLHTCATEFGVTIAGGDVVSSAVFSVTVALLGEPSMDVAGAPALLRRDAARAGDAIAVSGPLGGSAGGLRMLLSGDEDRSPLLARHMRPRPRIDAGTAAIAAGVQCAIDISDGLVQDLGHICRASGLGAEIVASRVPVDPALTAAFPHDAMTMALTGGEDYELILVAPAERIDAVSAALHAPLVIIGTMVETKQPAVRVLDDRGAEAAIENAGWDHLRGRGA
ncbi:MAG TPA: thiamine-phosphate kinase [Dehalococcoidia bacterium]